MPIHDNYNKLNPTEKEFVDTVLKRALRYGRSKQKRAVKTMPKLCNADCCERVAEALAAWCVESRKDAST